MRVSARALITGAIVVGLFLIAGIGVVSAFGPFGSTSASSRTMMGQNGRGTYGPNGMGSMMRPNGMGGMMGGATPTTQAQATPATGVTQIAMRNFAFQPDGVQVKVGTTVTWTNYDSAPHTVTFKNGGRGSSSLQQGQTFSYTFTAPGTYDYYCAVHTYMVARVIVTA
jgi:amicyanin